MKKILLVLLATGLCQLAFAQQQEYSIIAGPNLSKVKISAGSLSVSSDMGVGFHAGVGFAGSVNEQFKLRSAVLYSMESGKFSSFDFSGFGQQRVGKATMEMNFIKVPITIEYFAIEKVSLEAGITSDFILSAKAKDDQGKTFLEGTESFRKWIPGFTGGLNFYPIKQLGIRGRYEASLMSLHKEASEKMKFSKSQFTLGLQYTF